MYGTPPPLLILVHVLPDRTDVYHFVTFTGHHEIDTATSEGYLTSSWEEKSSTVNLT